MISTYGWVCRPATSSNTPPITARFAEGRGYLEPSLLVTKGLPLQEDQYRVGLLLPWSLMFTPTGEVFNALMFDTNRF